MSFGREGSPYQAGDLGLNGKALESRFSPPGHNFKRQSSDPSQEYIPNYQYLDQELSMSEQSSSFKQGNTLRLEECLGVSGTAEGEEASERVPEDPNYQYWYEGEITWLEEQINVQTNPGILEKIRSGQGDEVLIEQISYDQEYPRVKIKPNRVYPTFPTFKSKIRDKNGVYREICKVVKIDSASKRIKVKLRSPYKVYRWVNRSQVPPVLIEYYHEDKKQRRNQKITPTILGVFETGVEEGKGIQKVMYHFFIDEKMYFRVKLENGSQVILQRSTVVLNSPHKLVDYYSELHEKMQKAQEV